MKRIVILAAIVSLGLGAFGQSKQIIENPTKAFSGTSWYPTGNQVWRSEYMWAYTVTLHFKGMSATTGYAMLQSSTYIDSTFVTIPMVPADSIAIDAADKTVKFLGEVFSDHYMRWFYRNGSSATGQVTAKIIFSRKM